MHISKILFQIISKEKFPVIPFGATCEPFLIMMQAFRHVGDASLGLYRHLAPKAGSTHHATLYAGGFKYNIIGAWLNLFDWYLRWSSVY